MPRDRAVDAVAEAARDGVAACPRCETTPRITARAEPPPRKGPPWIAVRGTCACPRDERDERDEGDEGDKADAVTAALTELGLRTVPRFCACCERCTPYGLIARLVPSASGPGFEVIACLPCARLLATHPDAPDWLLADLARIDAAPDWVATALTPAAAP